MYTEPKFPIGSCIILLVISVLGIISPAQEAWEIWYLRVPWYDFEAQEVWFLGYPWRKQLFCMGDTTGAVGWQYFWRQLLGETICKGQHFSSSEQLFLHGKCVCGSLMVTLAVCITCISSIFEINFQWLLAGFCLTLGNRDTIKSLLSSLTCHHAGNSTVARVFRREPTFHCLTSGLVSSDQFVCYYWFYTDVQFHAMGRCFFNNWLLFLLLQDTKTFFTLKFQSY